MRHSNSQGEFCATATQLLLSTSRYHETYVPLSRIINAARASIDRGIKVQLSICVPRGMRDQYVSTVEEKLGKELLSQLEIIISPLESGGRAADLPEAQWREKGPEFPCGHCDRINRPVVLEDGKVVACCNTPVVGCQSSESPLVLGNLKSHTLMEVYNQARSNPVVQAIRVLGPKFLAERLVENGLAGELKGLYRKGDICDLCADMMTNRDLLEALAQIFSSTSAMRDLAIARAARFGELEMLYLVD